MKIRIRDLVTFNEIIIKKGFTKSALAKKANISTPFFVQITNGVRHPSPTIAKKIIDTLELEFDDIFTIER